MPYTVSAAYTKVTCGNSSQGFTGKYAIPQKVPQLTSLAVTIIEIAVPVIIVLMGMIDLIKAITAGKEDEMKKAQRTLVRRLIAGAIVFFLFVVVKLLIGLVSDNSVGITDCMDCFINNSCSSVKVKK